MRLQLLVYQTLCSRGTVKTVRVICLPNKPPSNLNNEMYSRLIVQQQVEKSAERSCRDGCQRSVK